MPGPFVHNVLTPDISYAAVALAHLGCLGPDVAQTAHELARFLVS